VASFFSYAGAVWWSVAVAFFCATLGLGLAQPFVQRRRSGKARGDVQPPISAIIPIKLLDPGFAIAQASMFAQDYPAYEVLIGAAEQESPALDAARRIAASHPEVSCRFLRSTGTAAVSPKLNNLAPPLAAARHDLVFTKDSNITLDPGTMAAFVQNFTQGVGLVVGVPVAVRARNFAGRIEAVSINGHARLLLAASALGVEPSAKSMSGSCVGASSEENTSASLSPWSRWRARFRRPSRARSRRRLVPIPPGSASP
jgi:ceramide glucosyltransferase